MRAPERRVELEASFNFRDLGGLETTSGARIRPGLVFRSDLLHWLTPTDASVVLDLGVRSVIDLRSTSELRQAPPSAHLVGLTHLHTPIFEFDALPFDASIIAGDLPPGRLYLDFARECGAAIAAAIAQIASCELGVVVHCAAGKDRTGVVVALLLRALGIPADSVIEDYALSSVARAPTIAWARRHAPDLAEELLSMPTWLANAAPENMRALLDHLDEQFGSPLGYLATIGVDDAIVEALRTRLLEA